MAARVRYRRGVKLDLDTVYVGRPTRWGNPFHVGSEAANNQEAVYLYERMLRYYLKVIPEAFPLEELRGKDLACWCPFDLPCHADVLLEFANGGVR